MTEKLDGGFVFLSPLQRDNLARFLQRDEWTLTNRGGYGASWNHTNEKISRERFKSIKRGEIDILTREEIYELATCFPGLLGALGFTVEVGV
jgi:hypothetical protein